MDYKMDYKDLEVNIKNSYMLMVVEALNDCFKMCSLPNIIPLLDRLLTPAMNIRFAYIGPPGTGKSSTIRNIWFATYVYNKLLHAKNKIADIIAFFYGYCSLKVIMPDNTVIVKYRPIDEGKRRKNVEEHLITTMDKMKPYLFHFNFGGVSTVNGMMEEILSVCGKVMSCIEEEEDSSAISENDEDWLRGKVRGRGHTAIQTFVRHYSSYLKRNNVIIVIDDFELPFCAVKGESQEYRDLRTFYRNFIESITLCGHVALFGSVGFPLATLNTTNIDIYSADNAKFKLLGIDKVTAANYLGTLGKSTEEIEEILKMTGDLLMKGWYPYNKLGLSRNSEIVTEYESGPGRISVRSALHFMCSLGFLKLFRKEDNEDCIENLGKRRGGVPDEFYSFTNTTMFYSYLSFSEKLTSLIEPRLSADPFINCDFRCIIFLFCSMFDKYVTPKGIEDDFADKLYFQLIKLFPEYVVTCRAMVEDTKGRVDICLYSYNDEHPVWVIELKIEEFLLSEIFKRKDIAFHQIYVRKYPSIMKRLDFRMADESKYNNRLCKTYVVAMVTDVKNYLYTAIREYNGAAECQCNNVTELCNLKADFGQLKDEEMYKTNTLKSTFPQFFNSENNAESVNAMDTN